MANSIEVREQPRTSAGHIGFSEDGSVEYYEQAGNVFRAPVANTFDIDGRRHGRWEARRAHFDRSVLAGRCPLRSAVAS